MLIRTLALSALALAASLSAAEPVAVPATAGIATRGWTQTQGGRGGRVIKVTTLAPSGPGSLKEAIEASGPRIVVFEVGGVIDMGGQPLKITQPFLTLAGQTAPDPGIHIIKAETTIATHDVVIQHLSFRPGEFGRPKKGGGDQDGISGIAGAHDVIVDHCSFSWATDENLSASGPRFDGKTPEDWRRATSHRMTYSHNLIYEGLGNSVHAKGEHSKGSLIHDNTSGVLLYGNVYASNRQRNALFKGGAQGAMVNNVIFNPGDRGVHYNLLANEWAGQPWQVGRLTLVGNAMRHGPSTVAGTAFFTMLGQGDLELHMTDNLAHDAHGRPVPLLGNNAQTTGKLIVLPQADLPPGLAIRPASDLARALPPLVGARPWARDPLDAKLLADMAEGKGRLIDSEVENALGYPRHAPTKRAFKAEDWNLDDMSPKAGWPNL
ncbi:polysaccharide lyase family 1 protein [Roseateles sp. DXS20W]|uniref:Polysaccharide lyase family 1 protein n=1 Tax=Pelomonas lactea TaxID=3299030 RepID=A0ABW7GJN1_9BURK